MEKIYIYNQSIKTSGKIRVRFRLRDGRRVELYHKSDILADADDLSKFNIFCEKQGRSLLKRPQLVKEFEKECAIMSQAYHTMIDRGVPLTSKFFETAISDIKHPDRRLRQNSVLSRFHRFIEDGYIDGLFAEGRYKHYKGTYGKLERFLTIAGRTDISAVDFDSNVLMEFRQFVFDEYKFVPKWRGLYTSMDERNIPKARRSQNYTSEIMKELQSFFAELENRNEIQKSPFRTLGRERKKAVMKSKYDAPVYLRKDEFLRVLSADVPASLRETKEAFVLQCSLGCRISDYKAMTMENVAVSDDGVPYVHYLPIKTKNEQSDNVEVVTPVVRFALDIIKGRRMNFRIVQYASGKSGYNVKIKDLLKFVGIDRQVAVFDVETNGNKYVPLYECGSSKLARKTYVDMLAKVQVDPYVSGLHKVGSDAVNHYTNMELKDRFALASLAFDQPVYHVDSDLNIIGE